MERLIRNIDDRLARVEQILPTLATKEELQAAIAPLVTREEMRAAIREEGEQTRRHFDLVAEAMGFELNVVVEAHGTLDERVADIARRHADIEHWRDRFDMRVQALETAASPRRKK